MIEAIKRFFTEQLDSRGEQDAARLEARMQRATAALLIEVARADHAEHTNEMRALESALQKAFALTEAQTRELIALASEEVEEATSHYQFTALIKDHYTPAQKVHVIELMWSVAFADRELHKHEESLVRRLADLLYVPHRDFIAAKHRVMERLGVT